MQSDTITRFNLNSTVAPYDLNTIDPSDQGEILLISDRPIPYYSIATTDITFSKNGTWMYVLKQFADIGDVGRAANLRVELQILLML